MTLCENTGYLTLNGNNTKHHIIKVRADIKLHASTFTVVTLPVFFRNAFPQRMHWRNWELSQKTFFSDKATFHACRTINVHECCVWGSGNPCDIAAHDHDSLRSMCGALWQRQRYWSFLFWTIYSEQWHFSGCDGKQCFVTCPVPFWTETNSLIPLHFFLRVCKRHYLSRKSAKCEWNAWQSAAVCYQQNACQYLVKNCLHTCHVTYSDDTGTWWTHKKLFEVLFIDFSNTLYGWRYYVLFYCHLRPDTRHIGILFFITLHCPFHPG
jgi:hypothetical protein